MLISHDHYPSYSEPIASTSRFKSAAAPFALFANHPLAHGSPRPDNPTTS